MWLTLIQMWKECWMVAIILSLTLLGQVNAQGGPANAPDSLFQGIDPDTLPLPPAAVSRIDNIRNRPYTKGLKPVQVHRMEQNLLQSPRISLKIPGDSALQFNQQKIVWRDSTNYVWKGRSPDSLFQLKMVKNNNQLTGTLMTDTASYRIRPISNFLPGEGRSRINLHVITRMDVSSLTMIDSLRQHAGNSTNKTDDPRGKKKESTFTQTSTTDQGIMVVYTNHVTDEVADPHALAQSAVEDANSAYENSGVAVNLNLVHTREVDSDGSGDTDRDLQRLQDSTDGLIDQVHQWRDEYGADMVIMLTAATQSDEGGTITGEAYEIMADSSTAFAVVRYDFAEAPVYTLAHEVGHLQGADHNPADEIDPYRDYGHGYVNKQKEWRSIMAYNVDGCCSRIEFFSTPDVTYNEEPLGTETDHNNGRVITETAATVADFRPPYSLDVAVSGPSYVQSGDSATWQADVSGGQTPYSYRWYRSYSQDDNWKSLTDSVQFTEEEVQDNFTLKLEVEDESGDRKETMFRVFTDVKSTASEPTEQPKKYTLSSNYPNPFNPTTRFNYKLPEASYVKIAVYTITGRKVKVLKDGYQNNGEYSLTFNGENLSSGLYLLRMQADAKSSEKQFRQTVKMTLMK